MRRSVLACTGALALVLVLLAAFGANVAKAATLAAEGDGSRVPWDHWGLELFVVAVESSPTRDIFTFELRLRTGTDVAAVSVGYPRYRGTRQRLTDAVTRGDFPRDRVLRLNRSGSNTTSAGGVARRSFDVLVPAGARDLLIPLDGNAIRVDLADARSAPRAAVARHGLVDPPAPVPRPARPSPGRPVRLTTDVRWPGAAAFEDGALDAGESGDLLVDVTNDGGRTTRNVTVRLTPGVVKDVTFRPEVRLPRIDPGATATARFAFLAGADLDDGALRMTIEALEEFGHDARPLVVEVPTRAAAFPRLTLLDDFVVEMAGGDGGMALPVPRDAVVTVTLRVRNVGLGIARNVVAEVVPGDGVFRASDGPVRFDLGDLPPGGVAELDYRCYANRRAPTLGLGIVLFADRSRSRPTSHRIEIPLEGNGAPRIVRIKADPRDEVVLAPVPTPLVSSIDRAMPPAGTERPNGLAVVLGVERYANAPRALWSADDARTAARYFERVLGIPSNRIELLVDAEVTLAQFHRIFGAGGWLERRVRDDSEVFVFFAGHGVSATSSRTPFLVPSDGDTNYVEQTGFSLRVLLERVAELAAREATVFVDACFSGLTRGGDALNATVRPLVLVPVGDRVDGVSMFAATSGTQMAGALDSEGHGLFSYYLFRGLGGAADEDADRRITTGELRDYLERIVPIAAQDVDREQQPTVHLESEDSVLVSW